MTAEALAERIDDTVEGAVSAPTLAAASAAANETGVHRYQRDLLDALELLAEAQTTRRHVDFDLDPAREELAAAVAAAEWTLGGHFVVRSNKSWLAVDEHDGAIAEDDQRSLDADAKKAWIARVAGADPDVKTAAAKVRDLERRRQEAADTVSHTERCVQAYRHLLDSAVAELATIRLALTAPTRENR
jgi:hypothetical protein